MTDLDAARSALETERLATSAAERYASQLKRYLFRQLRIRADVEDCAQEVYLRLLRISPEIQMLKPLAFVLTVAKSVLIDHRRSEARRAAAERAMSADEALNEWYKHASDQGDPLEDDLAVRQLLEQALSKIPPMHAAVLVLHTRDGLAYKEVAEKLNLSEDTVHKYLTQARTRLRMTRWEDKEPRDGSA